MQHSGHLVARGRNSQSSLLLQLLVRHILLLLKQVTRCRKSRSRGEGSMGAQAAWEPRPLPDECHVQIHAGCPSETAYCPTCSPFQGTTPTLFSSYP